MTTDTPAAPAAWAEWKKRGMLRAEAMVDAMWGLAVAATDEDANDSRGKLEAARAALAAHLDSLPMRELIAEVVLPLYRHPKES